MKRFSILMLAVMVFTTVVASANPFSDVPFSHWAYDAVNKLSVRGIVQGFPDGTFKGSKEVTRYQMAMMVAKMLASVEQMMESGMGTNLVTKADLQTLEKLTVEFADELALLGVKVTALEDDMQVVKEDVAILRNDVDGIKTFIAQGGTDKVSVGGDLRILAHNGEQEPNTDLEGITTTLRFNFNMNIDENVKAVARWNAIVRHPWNQRNINDDVNNAFDRAYVQLKNPFDIKGDMIVGRQYVVRGHSLIINDNFDGVIFNKKAGEVDLSFGALDNDARMADGSKNLIMLGAAGKFKDHDVYANIYYREYDDNMAADTDLKDTIIELGAAGTFGDKGTMGYDLSVANVKQEGDVIDHSGIMAYGAFKYDDAAQDWALKVAYGYADDEVTDFGLVDYDQRYLDGVESPFEDIMRASVLFGAAAPGGAVTNFSNIKVQGEYRPVDSKHYARLAVDMLKADDDTLPRFVATDPNGEAMVLTFEYRYQFAENTRLSIGYTDFANDTDNCPDYGIAWVELFSRF